jgi:hypothetical protein
MEQAHRLGDNRIGKVDRTHAYPVVTQAGHAKEV